MSDWYSEAREADGRTDEEVMAEIRLRRDAKPPIYEYDAEYRWIVESDGEGSSRIVAKDVLPSFGEWVVVQSPAFRMALTQIEHDAETINRLTRALRVAHHKPHDQLGKPDNGFPVCSVCGAIQTSARE